MTPRIDHLMWGVPDLDAGMKAAQRFFGVMPAPGGSHTGLGTRNALLGLGEDVYLEILAPDPAQAANGNFSRSMGAALQRLAAPALVTFAVAVDDLGALTETLRQRGYRTRGPLPTERLTPDGQRLAWDLLFVGGHSFGGLCPFFINWRDSPHPSASLPAAAQLDGVALGSPAADTLGQLLADLHIPVTVARDAHPWLRGSFSGAFGNLTLESVDSSLALAFA